MFQLNYLINLLNLFLIFIYFILLNINLIKKEYEFLLIALILINLIIKLYNWYNFNIRKKQYISIYINNIFFDDRLIKLNILVLSILIPVYMIFQKDSLVTDFFIEKMSFFFVFIFSLIGFYLEFFILESKSSK